MNMLIRSLPVAALATVITSAAFATMPRVAEQEDTPTIYATSMEKCQTPEMGTPGLAFTSGRLIGYEWQCRIVGGIHRFTDSMGAVLECSEEGTPVNRLALLDVQPDGSIMLDISDDEREPVVLHRCP